MPAKLQAKFDEAYARHERGDLDRAESGYLAILKKEPAHAPSIYMLGLAAYQRQKYSQSIRYFQQAIKLMPYDADAYFELSNAQHAYGLLDEALASINHAIHLNPHNADFYCNRGAILRNLCRMEEALQCYQQGLRLNPDDTALWYNLGNALLAMNLLEDALNSHKELLRRSPDHYESWNNIGLILHRMGQYQTALQAFEKAIAINPNAPEAYCNAGGYWDSLHQPEKALQYYAKAIEACGEKPELHQRKHDAQEGYALVLLSLNRPAEAEQVLRQVMESRKDKASAGFNLALSLLVQGKMQEGWAAYEWRHAENGVQAGRYMRPDTARWTGQENLARKRILIQKEQGLGDLIQFSRYIPHLIERGAHVIVEVPESLSRLFQSLFPDVELAIAGTQLPQHDFHIPVLSLPRAFETNLDNIPPIPPLPDLAWLAPQAAQQDASIARIGVVWSGNIHHTNDRNRSIALGQLQPLFQAIDAQWYCLQTEIKPADGALLPACPFIIQNPPLNDFADTAALIEQLDLVISVDTSVAHLAGTLGKPVWILLPFAPDFRWLLDRDDSPWYPTAKLFRQPSPGDWASVISHISTVLQHKFY